MPLTTAQFQAIVSQDRFGRYVTWAGNADAAMTLYLLNTALSECLYTPIQILEITLRNRIHANLNAAYGLDWIEGNADFLQHYQVKHINEAIARIEEAQKAVNPSRIVAELNFGFWTSLVGRDHEVLWREQLNKITRRGNGKSCMRKDLAGPLARVRTLRNRIAHHEPILHLELPAVHQEIQTICRWLDPNAAAWLAETSHFAAVFPAGGIAFAPPADQA